MVTINNNSLSYILKDIFPISPPPSPIHFLKTQNNGIYMVIMMLKSETLWLNPNPYKYVMMIDKMYLHLVHNHSAKDYKFSIE